MNVKQEGSSPAAEEEEDETPAHTLSDLVPSPRVSSLSTSPPPGMVGNHAVAVTWKAVLCSHWPLCVQCRAVVRVGLYLNQWLVPNGTWQHQWLSSQESSFAVPSLLLLCPPQPSLQVEKPGQDSGPAVQTEKGLFESWPST